MSADMSLFKLSDALQIPIHFDGRNVEGTSSLQWKSDIGLVIPVQLTAKALFISEQVGVIVKVVGNLHLMVAHNPEKNGLSAYAIDKSKLPKGEFKDMISQKMTLREVVEFLGASVVKSYYHNGTAWKPLKLPK